jgi:hypothetical protein
MIAEVVEVIGHVGTLVLANGHEPDHDLVARLIGAPAGRTKLAALDAFSESA